MSERDEMVYAMARLGVRLSEVATVLRCLPTLQRGHEAECCAWRPETVAAFSERADRAWDRIATALAGVLVNGRPVRVVRQRDPRGAAVQVYRWADNVDSAEPVLRLGMAGFTAGQMERIERIEDRAQRAAV